MLVRGVTPWLAQTPASATRAGGREQQSQLFSSITFFSLFFLSFLLFPPIPSFLTSRSRVNFSFSRSLFFPFFFPLPNLAEETLSFGSLRANVEAAGALGHGVLGIRAAHLLQHGLVPMLQKQKRKERKKRKKERESNFCQPLMLSASASLPPSSRSLVMLRCRGVPRCWSVAARSRQALSRATESCWTSRA
jgi:hypothetical protein